ncbi:MAG: leucyl aminopeptidase [Acidimicrobiaceae bacterium]|jgi:leucyl aminopeptidase|nr:leucyl aminopeptidase [Acidimicrobiaceae bacterium]
MLQIETAPSSGLETGLVAVGIPVFTDAGGPEVAPDLPESIAGAQVPTVLDAAWLKRQGFTGKVGQSLVLRNEPGSPATVLLGWGARNPNAGDEEVEAIRRSAAAFVRATGEGGAGAVAIPAGLALEGAVVAAALAEGATLAAYRFDAYRTGENHPRLDRLILAVCDGAQADAVAEGARRGSELAAAVSFARDLVNEPPSSLTPTKLAQIVSDRLSARPGVTVEVWDEDRIVAEHLGGLLGVARGSVEPPRLVRAQYTPAEPVEVNGRVPHVVLVGKGITFDSGGLSLKSAGGMETMKTDMGGAAAVLAAFDAAAVRGVPVRVTALAPMTENMPGGRAIKPGDVLTARNGKTIEVLNTDAEGRLVLADALSLATEMEPDAIIDLATLTGAAVVALGTGIAGLLGNNEELQRQLRSASERAGESLWPLPLPDEYRSHIDSEVADMKNIGRAGQAGSISAALLLREFVGDVPWAHLDIAGPARSDEDARYLTKGGTGFGVRTLVALLSSAGFAESLGGSPG